MRLEVASEKFTLHSVVLFCISDAAPEVAATEAAAAATTGSITSSDLLSLGEDRLEGGVLVDCMTEPGLPHKVEHHQPDEGDDAHDEGQKGAALKVQRLKDERLRRGGHHKDDHHEHGGNLNRQNVQMDGRVNEDERLGEGEDAKETN